MIFAYLLPSAIIISLDKGSFVSGTSHFISIDSSRLRIEPFRYLFASFSPLIFFFSFSSWFFFLLHLIKINRSSFSRRNVNNRWRKNLLFSNKQQSNGIEMVRLLYVLYIYCDLRMNWREHQHQQQKIGCKQFFLRGLCIYNVNVALWDTKKLARMCCYFRLDLCHVLSHSFIPSEFRSSFVSFSLFGSRLGIVFLAPIKPGTANGWAAVRCWLCAFGFISIYCRNIGERAQFSFSISRCHSLCAH